VIGKHDGYPRALLAAFTVIWAALAIAPLYRQDWLLENVIVFVAVPMLVLTHRSLRLSNFAYTCLFVFLVLHEVGAHFTYSEVPWREWLHAFGVESGSAASRNHYDRMVHFAYGLLVFPAVWELFAARAQPRGMWRYLMPFLFLMGHSVVYELIE
jgi:putative membrane protein